MGVEAGLAADRACRMRPVIPCRLSAGPLAACATVPAVSEEDRTLTIECGDIVAIGDIENIDYTDASSEGDLLGHGWFSAALNVRRTVKSKALKRVVRIRYFSHAEMRQNTEFGNSCSPLQGGRCIWREGRPTHGRSGRL